MHMIFINYFFIRSMAIIIIKIISLCIDLSNDAAKFVSVQNNQDENREFYIKTKQMTISEAILIFL